MFVVGIPSGCRPQVPSCQGHHTFVPLQRWTKGSSKLRHQNSRRRFDAITPYTNYLMVISRSDGETESFNRGITVEIRSPRAS